MLAAALLIVVLPFVQILIQRLRAGLDANADHFSRDYKDLSGPGERHGPSRSSQWGEWHPRWMELSRSERGKLPKDFGRL